MDFYLYPGFSFSSSDLKVLKIAYQWATVTMTVPTNNKRGEMPWRERDWIGEKRLDSSQEQTARHKPFGQKNVLVAHARGFVETATEKLARVRRPIKGFPSSSLWFWSPCVIPRRRARKQSICSSLILLTPSPCFGTEFDLAIWLECRAASRHRAVCETFIDCLTGTRPRRTSPEILHEPSQNPLDGAKERIGRQIMQSPLRSIFEQGTSKARQRAKRVMRLHRPRRDGLQRRAGDPHSKPARSWRRNNVIMVVKTQPGSAAWLLGCLSVLAGDTGTWGGTIRQKVVGEQDRVIGAITVLVLRFGDGRRRG